VRELRRTLTDEAAILGVEHVHRRLSAVDPQSAARLAPQDVRRVIRALEVFAATGIPLSQQQRQPALPAESRPRHVYWLCPDREWLYPRIERRLEEMFAAGLVAEVEQLKAAGTPLSRTARQALGYKEVLEYLAGARSLPETVALIQTRTRQFAKRQFTWFRNLEECRAIPIKGTESPDEIARRVLEYRIQED
jgi:tRNA dimethylallyltransferase